MGNQCCTAQNTVPDSSNPTTPFSHNIEEAVDNGDTQHFTKDPTVRHDVKAQVQEELIIQQVAAQVIEENENKTVVTEFKFKKQLESLARAMNNAENLKNIAIDGQKLTHAIAEVEVIIQMLSQSVTSTQYIRDFKTDLIGLYGDLQMFRSFHLRYTIDESYFSVLPAVSDIALFLRQVYATFIKDGKTNHEAFAKELYSGNSHTVFEEHRVHLNVVRDNYNRISGQNFSTLPNYLYVTFNNQPGFNLWTKLFPNDFETSNKEFSEKYAFTCGVSKEKIFEIISLLDNANDQRVDIYQWMDFVKEYQAILDSEGKIDSVNIDSFADEIANKSQVMKVAPILLEDGAYKFQSGMTYRGKLDENNLRQEEGSLKDDDYEFEGVFLNDLPNGMGKETRKKVIYEGQFSNGLYHGQGCLTFPNGRSYRGNFANHQFHGEGELIGDDGIKYQGNWKLGALDHGTITYHDGSHYAGQLYLSLFKHGKGSLHIIKPSLTAVDKNAAPSEKTIIYIEGTWEKDAPLSAKVFNYLETVMYEGTLSNWSITGKGKRLYLDGSYDGELLRDKKTNEGTLTFKNGDKYVGKWLEDVQTKGIFYYGKEKDHFYEGEWNNGVMEGKGKFTYQTGGSYEGDVKDGKRNGYGVYKYHNGNRYEGQWVDNNQEGEGKFFYVGENGAQGDVYYGQFNKGKFHGFGHYIYKKSGKQYIGFWAEDTWNGEGKFIGPDGKAQKVGIWKNDKLETKKTEADLLIPPQFQHFIMSPSV